MSILINILNKNWLLIALLLFSSILKAQTGIGTTTPDASAKLDVYSTTQGFLPPRVALTGKSDNTTIKNAAGTSITPANGLLVYNTSAAGTAPNNVVVGYYYWNVNNWVQISNGVIIDNSKSAAFTLSASDNNKIFLISSATSLTVTVSNVSPNILPVGFSCQFIQIGAGAITLNGSGVTLNSSNGLTTRAPNSVIGLVMSTTSTGFVMGDSIF